MKKLFLIILLLLIPSLAYSQWQEARMNVGIVGGGTPAEVVGDGFVGLEATGSAYGAAFMQWSLFAVTTPGTVSYIHVKFSLHASGNLNVGLYDSDKNLLRDSTSQDGTGSVVQYNFAITAYVLEAGHSYYLATANDWGEGTLYYGTGSERLSGYTTTISDVTDMPAVIPTESWGYDTSPLIIWADNSAT